MASQDGLEKPHVARFHVDQVKATQVVVFSDRAEVTRSLAVPVASMRVGRMEVVLEGIRSTVDEDSVRVQGSGAATILDVSISPVFAARASIPDAENEAVLALQRERLAIGAELERARTQRQVFDSYFNLTSHASDFEKTPTLSSAALEQLEHHVKEWERLGSTNDERTIKLTARLAELESAIRAERSNLARRHNMSVPTERTSELTVALDVRATEQPLTLVVTYLVTGASWSPSYDLRVFSEDQTMVVTYYGDIQQSTKEDWTDVDLTLSTAMPAAGGSAPDLAPWHIKIDRPRYRRIVHTSLAAPSASMPPEASQMRERRKRRSEAESVAEDEDADLQVSSAAAVASSMNGSTAFVIPHEASVPADGSSHRVTIAIASMTPQFEHYAVPKLTPLVFLRAKVRNISEYEFLPGPANVFLNNNYIAHSTLKAVAPQEEFECSLGADTSVRIEYPPIKRFSQSQGIFVRSASTAFHQLITVKNTKRTAVKVTLQDQIPVSDDETIKVTAEEPDLKRFAEDEAAAQRAGIKLTDKSTITWTFTVPAGLSHSVNLRYTVTAPVGVSIDGLNLN